MTLIEYRGTFAESLLRGVRPTRIGREMGFQMGQSAIKRQRNLASVLPSTMKHQKVDHIPELLDIKNPARCKRPGCGKKTHNR